MLRDLFHPRRPTSPQLALRPDPELPSGRRQENAPLSPTEFNTGMLFGMGTATSKVYVIVSISQFGGRLVKWKSMLRLDSLQVHIAGHFMLFFN